MAVATAIDFKTEVKKLFSTFDRLDFDALKAMFTDDAQGVDEISRKWLRGKSAFDGYFDQVKAMGVGNIHSKLSDLRSEQWDDVAVVTCLADQTYEVGGEKVSILAPTTVVFRYNKGDWKIALVHAVPLPEAM